jgi:hypothetical protein
MPWHAHLRNVFRAERLNEELDSELAFHIAETVDRLVAEGMPEEEAWSQARRRLGNYSIQKERTRDMATQQMGIIGYFLKPPSFEEFLRIGEVVDEALPNDADS